MTGSEYRGMGTHKETISISVMNSVGKVRNGMCHRDENEHDSAVHSGSARSRSKAKPDFSSYRCNF